MVSEIDSFRGMQSSLILLSLLLIIIIRRRRFYGPFIIKRDIVGEKLLSIELRTAIIGRLLDRLSFIYPDL
jgi:hypothetical protein